MWTDETPHKGCLGKYHSSRHLFITLGPPSPSILVRESNRERDSCGRTRIEEILKPGRGHLGKGSRKPGFPNVTSSHKKGGEVALGKNFRNMGYERGRRGPLWHPKVIKQEKTRGRRLFGENALNQGPGAQVMPEERSARWRKGNRRKASKEKKNIRRV